jgi:prevent-host-death family protein
MSEVREMSSREARERWREVLDTVMKGENDIAITRYGEPIAVVIPADDYEALAEEIEELRRSRLAERIYEDYLADRDSAVTLESVKSELLRGG